jgi:hypothetical protein
MGLLVIAHLQLNFSLQKEYVNIIRLWKADFIRKMKSIEEKANRH